MSNPRGNIKHGGHGSLTHKRWEAMMARCYQINSPNYKRYGELGITVCERWHDFATFRADMGECTDSLLTLDRIDNAKGYEPHNCRWATMTEQARNKTNNRILNHAGESLCVGEWAERTGLPYYTIVMRLKRGWSIDRTLTVLRDARAGRVVPSKTYRRSV